MKYALTALLLFAGFPLAAQSPALRPDSELTLGGPWDFPVSLVLPEPGSYRLEAAGPAGAPVEVVVEKLVSGRWEAGAGNRNRDGSIRAEVEWRAGAELWRVRPLRPAGKTVLRLRKASFTALRDALKQEITASPEVGLPLRRRLELPLGTGGEVLAAAVGRRGELWIGWLNGGRAEVWDAAQGARLGTLGPQIWKSLELQEGPVAVLTGKEREARVWSGLDWAVEAPPLPSFTTPLGTFRYETSPPRVWRGTTTGWVDLGLPHTRMDRMLLGSTEDGLYALLADSRSAARAFYLWQPGGWSALKPPPASSAPGSLWAATNGAGSLFHLESTAGRLELRQFDGDDWRQPLDLTPLAPGLGAAVLLPPSPWSKTGTLVLAADRIAVYDLP